MRGPIGYVPLGAHSGARGAGQHAATLALTVAQTDLSNGDGILVLPEAQDRPGSRGEQAVRLGVSGLGSRVIFADQ